MVKIYAASQTPRIYGSGAGTLDTTPFLLFDETLPAIASPTTLGYGEHVELTSPVTVGLPNPRKGAKLVIRNMSGGYSSVAAGAILYKGDTYTSLDFDTNTVALLKVVDGVWTASFVTEGAPFLPIVATGGTVTEFTDPGTGITYRVHSFTSVGSSTFTVSSLGTTSGEVEYLVVAGGAGGGGRAGAGGGAGGYRCSVVGEQSGGGASAESPHTIAVGIHTITVGAGGPGGSDANNGLPGGFGGNSVFDGITSIGGGGGGGAAGSSNYGGRDGGSGGGGAYSAAGGVGTPGQGFSGGGSSFANYNNGGGGGAGASGQTGTNSFVGSGGNGVTSSITGTPVTRAGGGGGGTHTPHPNRGFGGTGGGGDGGTLGYSDGFPGVANTGGGGGGACSNGGGTNVGGDGGSGIIIVRYAIAYP